MDPYLEQEVVWHDFHEKFIPAAAAYLTAQVLPRYIVLIDENVYLHDLPVEESRLVGRADLSMASLKEWICRTARGESESRRDRSPPECLYPDEDDWEWICLTYRDEQAPKRFG
jgi:hypothetical protein